MQRGLGQPRSNPMNVLEMIRQAELKKQRQKETRKADLCYRGVKHQVIV